MPNIRHLALILLGLALSAPAVHADPVAGVASHVAADDSHDRVAQVDMGEVMEDVNAVLDAIGMTELREHAETPPEAAETTPAPRSEGAPDPARATTGGERAARSRDRAGPHIPSPVVVELFTAQGCADCVAAEDMLSDLAQRSDVLALSWHVDYWDYLGWPDDLARPEFSARQRGYNLLRGARSLFTPQFVIGGKTAIARPAPAEVMRAVKHDLAEPDRLTITRQQDGAQLAMELTPRGPLPAGMVVQLVRFVPRREVLVTAGENRGRHLKLRNVVAASEVLASWNGKAPLRLRVTLGAGAAGDLPEDTRHALLVQQMHGSHPGEIFAALILD